MTWNLSWFLDPDHVPADDAAQYAGARDVIAESQPSLLALQEICSAEGLHRLLRDLPDYAGVLSEYAWTQKTALLWSKAEFELIETHPIDLVHDAGRPPLLVRLRQRTTGQRWDVVVIHAKAQSDTLSYDTRVAFAEELKARLDATFMTGPALLLGDFNDLLQGSITHGRDSPYAAFGDDMHYALPELQADALASHERSFRGKSMIDHIIVSAAVDERWRGAIDVLQDELSVRFPDYQARISDHYPVLLQLAVR